MPKGVPHFADDRISDRGDPRRRRAPPPIEFEWEVTVVTGEEAERLDLRQAKALLDLCRWMTGEEPKRT